jgi:hypothetical protein
VFHDLNPQIDGSKLDKVTCQQILEQAAAGAACWFGYLNPLPGVAPPVHELNDDNRPLNAASNILLGNFDWKAALFDAARRADLRLIDQLFNVDINAVDHDGMTPLLIAAQKKDVALVLKLIEKGARLDTAFFTTATEIVDGGNLLHAICAGNETSACLPLLEKLLSSGADVQDGNGFTMLMLSARVGHLEKVRLLLGHETTITQNAQEWKDDALDICEQYEQWNVFEDLLKCGATQPSWLRDGFRQRTDCPVGSNHASFRDLPFTDEHGKFIFSYMKESAELVVTALNRSAFRSEDPIALDFKHMKVGFWANYDEKLKLYPIAFISNQSEQDEQFIVYTCCCFTLDSIIGIDVVEKPSPQYYMPFEGAEEFFNENATFTVTRSGKINQHQVCMGGSFPVTLGDFDSIIIPFDEIDTRESVDLKTCPFRATNGDLLTVYPTMWYPDDMPSRRIHQYLYRTRAEYWMDVLKKMLVHRGAMVSIRGERERERELQNYIVGGCA